MTHKVQVSKGKGSAMENTDSVRQDLTQEANLGTWWLEVMLQTCRAGN